MFKKLISSGLLAVLVSQTAAYAQSTVADGVISQLRSDGYTVTEVRRSWLGRIVITANSNDNLREVVLNRTSGEVLRDQVFETTRRPEGDASPALPSKGSAAQQNTQDNTPSSRNSPDGPGNDRSGGGGHSGSGGHGGGGHGGGGEMGSK